jgi:hypothetical protein
MAAEPAGQEALKPCCRESHGFARIVSWCSSFATRSTGPTSLHSCQLALAGECRLVEATDEGGPQAVKFTLYFKQVRACVGFWAPGMHCLGSYALHSVRGVSGALAMPWANFLVHSEAEQHDGNKRLNS